MASGPGECGARWTTTAINWHIMRSTRCLGISLMDPPDHAGLRLCRPHRCTGSCAGWALPASAPGLWTVSVALGTIVQGGYKKKRQRGSPSHCGPLVEASTRQLRRTRESLLSRRNEPRTTGAHNGPRISSEHLQRLVSLLASWACGSVDVRRFKVWRARGDGRLGPGTSRVCACARARVQPSGRAGVRVHPRACARACGHDWMGARVPPKAP